ncbi:hypothetical protein SAMN05880590_101145 [Rhizobium sp. RU35A]|uniref:hypothetical protein n=1 Tax=Rhizobium sp. RU35A TaxID=1907414 RepID=UPI0009566D4C|nr:hypothetical protein [Rhizobium sp. RU35A]SIP90906.1 hypothetical protein SAMN05880590_101145 [Rhizobium sp. RU35A]
MTLLRSTRTLLAGSMLAFAAAPAWALDGTDLLNKITRAANLEAGNLAVTGIDVSGQRVTLKGLSVGEGGGERLTIGDVVLDGVTEEANGSYAIDKVTFPNVNLSEEKAQISASDMYLSDVVVPGDTSGDTLDSMLFYGEAHMGPMQITVEGQKVWAISEISVTMERSEDDSGLSFDGTIDGIAADLSSIDDIKTREALQSLGLTQIAGKITMQGDWEIASGTFDISEYAFDFANIGRLNIAATISGYTPAFMKAVQETTRTLQNNPNKEAAQQAQMFAIFGLLQQLSFNRAEVRFDDSGITNRALSFAGKSQGVSGDQMAMMVKGSVPLIVAQWNLPTLQNSLSAAVNAFIDHPRNLTVTAEPANPVPFPMIIGAAQSAPNTLPDVLGIKVSANQ